jgi:hypothetical protein
MSAGQRWQVKPPFLSLIHTKRPLTSVRSLSSLIRMTFVDNAVIADWFEAECVRRLNPQIAAKTLKDQISMTG